MSAKPQVSFHPERVAYYEAAGWRQVESYLLQAYRAVVEAQTAQVERGSI